jgi:predicted ABC-type transport system involved in lysophospholipase L1 biosynthesis ATPase subunit
VTAALLELRGVHHRYAGVEGGADGPEVLRGVDLTVEFGESIAVVGPSGSGKSTLLNLIGGLDRPSAGQVLLEGQDLTALSPDALAGLRSEKIGFVFQSHHLLPQCTALENVLVPTLVQATRSRDLAAARGRELLSRVGLGQRERHVPAQLSGGERQRVALVRALINQPALLLADEPTGSLDSASSDQMATLLAELNREQGVTLITVTHSSSLAERMGRVLALADGRLSER